MDIQARIQCDEEGSVRGLESILANAARYADSGHGLLILACEENGFSPDTVDPLLCSAPLPVFGGTFPKIIMGRTVLTRGTVAVALPLMSRSYFIPGLSSEEARFDELLEETCTEEPSGGTMMVFVDGSSLRITPFIEALFDMFGLDLNYVGGGAGSLCEERRPCLITNEGMRSDGAVLALTSCASGVGVCHGWKELSGPYQVTESCHNAIKSLDWRPALDVYIEAISSHCAYCYKEQGFYFVAKAYPFGISRLGAEQIVRDPIWVGEDHSLLCAGETPEASFVHILNGDAESLIEAADTATRRAQAARGPAGANDICLFIDCISRPLFLERRFHEELDAVYREGLPLVGACTIGEIANSGEDFLEFYNKTAVVAVIDIT